MNKIQRGIYCPLCGTRIGDCDSNTAISHSVACNKCNHLVVYNLKDKVFKIKKIPERTQSSGMRFY